MKAYSRTWRASRPLANRTCPDCGQRVQVMADGFLARHFDLAIQPAAWCDQVVRGPSIPDLAPAIGGSRGNGFCGPGALAMLLAIGTDEAAALIRKVSGKVAVFGVQPEYMLAALRSAGARVDLVAGGLKPALQQWAFDQQPGCYLVNVTGHYVAVRVTPAGIEAGDNRTIYPMALDRFPRRRQRVKAAWKVVRNG